MSSLFSMEKCAEQELQGIKYVKAKSLEEAKDYATNVLGMRRFDVTDLDIANQFNYTTTQAFNKTRCRDFIPDEFVMQHFSKINSPTMKQAAMSDTKFYSHTPAVTFRINQGGNRVSLSLDYIESLDKTINGYLEHLSKYGQLTKNSKGLNQIDLICDYQYSDTLNRYYKLYQQGKLTPKAKIDFHSLLSTAADEERSLLSRKNAITDFVKEHTSIDLTSVSDDEYMAKAIENLLNIKKNKGIINGTGKQRRAVGLDKYLLHEEGHVFQNNQPINSSAFKTFANTEEEILADGISTYAGLTPNEMVAEKFAGELSGEIYGTDVENMFVKYAGKRIPNAQQASKREKTILEQYFETLPPVIDDEETMEISAEIIEKLAKSKKV